VTLAGHRFSEIQHFSWTSFLVDENGDWVEYGDSGEDWMASIDIDTTSKYFQATSVANANWEEGHTFVVNLWITEYSSEDATEEDTDEMWAELLERTPLPDELTEDQSESLYKQLWCHAAYARDGLGGGTWDLEAGRDNIPWDQVGDVAEHKCNWWDGGWSDNWPTVPGTDEPPADTSPAVYAGPDITGDEGEDVVLEAYATDDNGTPEVRWSYEPLDGVDEGATCTFADETSSETDVSCTDDGPFELTLTADDGVNPPVSDSAVLTLGNVAPDLTLSGPSPWQVFRVGDSVDLAASFTDPGENDTHTCTVDWDDGTGEEEFAAQGGACDRDRVFDEAGMYTIDLVVTDDDGGSDSSSVMVVVYDPRAGLLTGAGTVDDATFAVAGKYPTSGSDTPLGTLTFSAPTDEGRMAFTTTDAEWLVITPDGEAAMKGSAGDYGFVVYATSGKFRAVVWPLASGDYPQSAIVYDNVRDASFDIDDAEPHELQTGVTIIDSGWIPGIPLPGGILGE
jgi:hypothetical protein